MGKDVILAYELNGQPLPETLRLVIPNENGVIKWIALITQICVVTAPVSVLEQPNLTPTMFPEAGKSQTVSSSQSSDESTQANNESILPPVVLPSQVSDNSTIQLQEFLRTHAPVAKTLELDRQRLNQRDLHPRNPN
jgi:DMSO/TMAO reductase YedYZ molybdopterin-dependent catalytic subunit